jgi:hypothetical protein
LKTRDKRERAQGLARGNAASLALALGAALCLASCHGARQPQSDTQATPDPAEAAQPKFLEPPVIVSVTPGAGGSAEVNGLAAPDSRIRAVTTDQASYGATAGHDGRFTLELPSVGRTRLVSLSMEEPNRSTVATGWLFVPPDLPQRAVLLKAGAPAEPLAGAGLIAAVDYDAGGGLTVSGRASPKEILGLALDSGETQAIRTDSAGVWSMRFPDTLKAGTHVLHLRTPTSTLDRPILLAPRPFQGVFEAVREADDWRVDWRPRGGGAQTTLVFTGGAS